MRVNSQFALLFLLFLSPLARPQDVLSSRSSEGSQSPEIRLVRPPLWHDHYLEITVKWVIHSKSHIFLPPTPGVKMYSSVTKAKSTLELGGQEAWILVYGWSDVIESGGITLAPGSQGQNTYYIRETFPVKDMVTNATRQVRLQGRLRISTGYERILHGRSASCERGETLTVPANVPYHLSHGDHRVYFIDSEIGCSGQVTLEFRIPCPVGIANADCSVPPPVFPGERDQWTIQPEAPVL